MRNRPVRFAGNVLAVSAALACCGCRYGDAVSDGVAGAITEVISTVLISILLPGTV